ncbi:MAG: hypothetical protein K2W96_04960 [Gemmataceae bacterium]|nr:hypothetical protein [Gemmataceae bacterium]
MRIGAARARLTPFWGVELAGWGYYLGRTWQRVRDHTAATALVAEADGGACAVIAVDLMYADRAFCDRVRELIAQSVPIPPHAVCVACSHSHNTPTVGAIRGAGEAHPEYAEWAARQAATAAIVAYRQRRPAHLSLGSTELEGWTENRTRAGGPVDTRLTVWRIDDDTRRPLAAVVGFQGHPTVQMPLGTHDLSRDFPGQVTDLLERELPGVTALYLQGACGEINIKAGFHDPDNCHRPGVAIAQAALQCWKKARPAEGETVRAVERTVTLPTRRWGRDEVLAVREECERRLATGDTAGWLDGFARVVVNYPRKLHERYGGSAEAAMRAVCRFGMEWSAEALADLDARPETLDARLQALRVGDAYLAANGAEYFSSLILPLRQAWGKELVFAGYANESIGYLPDADDVRRRTYAAWQSPKFKGQFPFTESAGETMAQAMLSALRGIEG